MRHIFTFNRSRTWEQHHAADFPPDVVGIANHCGIPKSFAIYAATGEFGARPLLYTGSIRLVVTICCAGWLDHFTHRSGDTIMLGWPVVLQAYDVTLHHHKSMWNFTFSTWKFRVWFLISISWAIIVIWCQDGSAVSEWGLEHESDSERESDIPQLFSAPRDDYIF